MNNIGASITAIAVAIIGVAIVAVIVSSNAQTPQVLQAAGSAFGGILQVAVSPVTNSGGATGTLGNLLTNSSGNYLNTFAGNANTGGVF